MADTSGVLMPFAVDDSGRTIFIGDVTSRFRALCPDPNCPNRNVVARKGDVNQPHFAHLAGLGTKCSGGETGMHRNAKAIFEAAGWIMLPPVMAWTKRLGTWRHIEVEPAAVVLFSKVVVESSVGDFRPDIRAWRADNGAEVGFEFMLTHPCDDIKIGKMARLGYSAVEIDLFEFYRSGISDYHKFKEAVLRTGIRKWLHHPVQAAAEVAYLADWQAMRAARIALQQAEARAAEEKAEIDRLYHEARTVQQRDEALEAARQWKERDQLLEPERELARWRAAFKECRRLLFNELSTAAAVVQVEIDKALDLVWWAAWVEEQKPLEPPRAIQRELARVAAAEYVRKRREMYGPDWPRSSNRGRAA